MSDTDNQNRKDTGDSVCETFDFPEGINPDGSFTIDRKRILERESTKKLFAFAKRIVAEHKKS